MRWWIFMLLIAFPAQAFAQQRGGGRGSFSGARVNGGRVGGYGTYGGYGGYGGYLPVRSYGRGFYYPRTNYNQFQIQNAPSQTVYHGNPDPPFVPYFTLLNAAQPAPAPMPMPMPEGYAPPMATAPLRPLGPEYISIRLHREPRRRRPR